MPSLGFFVVFFIAVVVITTVTYGVIRATNMERFDRLQEEIKASKPLTNQPPTPPPEPLFGWNQLPKLSANGPTYQGVVTLSANGTTRAVGSLGSTGNLTIQIYENNQLQSTIDCPALILDPIPLVPQYPDDFGFGMSISDDGNTLAVCDFILADTTGRCSIFVRSGITWTLDTIIASGTIGDFFANTVKISGDGQRVVIGLRNANNNRGTAHVYRKLGLDWIKEGDQMHIISANAFHGRFVSINQDGSYVLVASINRILVFNRDVNDDWNMQQTIQLLDQNNLDPPGVVNFSACCINSAGDKLAFVSLNDREGKGTISVWTRTGAVWTELSVIYPPNDAVLKNADTPYYNLTMSGDGTRLFASDCTFENDGGIVYFFENEVYISSFVGTNIDAGSNQGSHIEVSRDGTVLGISAFYDAPNKGAVVLFKDYGN